MKILEIVFESITARLDEKDTQRFFKRQIEKLKLDHYEPDHLIENMLDVIQEIQEIFNHGYEQIKGTKFSSDNNQEIPVESYLHRLNEKNIRLKDIQRVRSVLIRMMGEYINKITPPPTGITEKTQPPQTNLKSRIEIKTRRKKKPEIMDLKTAFINKYGSDEKFQTVMEELFQKGYLNEDKNLWIGKRGEGNGKGKLVSTIKYILEIERMKFTNEDVKKIADTTFNTTLSLGSAKSNHTPEGEF